VEEGHILRGFDPGGDGRSNPLESPKLRAETTLTIELPLMNKNLEFLGHLCLLATIVAILKLSLDVRKLSDMIDYVPDRGGD